MNSEEIMEMARQAGFTQPEGETWYEAFPQCIEACALICERVYKRMCPEAQENEVGIEAEIIRARGEA